MTKEKNQHKIAIIRVKGPVRLKKAVEDTLQMLRLYRRNYCVVLDSTPSIVGMVMKVKDNVTWGEIDSDMLKLLKEKREEMMTDIEGKIVPKVFFRLNPPRKGFGRKGVKKSFSVGGALGYRGEKINDLIKRML